MEHSPGPPTLPSVVLTSDYGRDAVRAARRRGRLAQVRRGAYVVRPDGSPPWVRREHMALAACVAAAAELRCEYAFSHETAALIHGCWLSGMDGFTHVTQRTRPSCGRGGLRRHQGRLPAGDITVVNGLPVTTLERTVEDCARAMPPRRALAVADSALRILARPDRRDRAGSAVRLEAARAELLERLDRRRGDRGVVRARAVIGWADGFAESVGESEMRWLAVANGLPRPISQMPVLTERGEYFTDLGWRLAATGTDERWTVAMEYDGADKYQRGPESLYAEKVREDAIRAVVHRFQRFVAADLRSPDRAFARMVGAFPSGVRRAHRPVPGLKSVPGAD